MNSQNSKPILNVAVIIGLSMIWPSSYSQSPHGKPLEQGPPGTVTYKSIHELGSGMKTALGIGPAAYSGSRVAPWQEQDARRFTSYRESIRDDSALQGKLRLKLTPIDRTALANYSYAGLIPNGPTLNGPWSSVVRVYLRPDGQPIFLYEWDYVGDGGSMVVFQELLNEVVRGIPARLVVKRSGDGRAISEIIWVTRSRDFKLTTWGDVLHPEAGSIYDKAWLKGMAEALTDNDLDTARPPTSTTPPTAEGGRHQDDR